MAHNDLSSVLAAAVMHRISLPKFISASGSADSIKIGEIRLSDTTVDHINVEGVKTELDTGTAALDEARAIVSLRIIFNYGIHIPLPWPFRDINIDDSVTVGTIRFPFEIGDITIPALNNIDLDIPSATLEDIQASLEPVSDLDLGGGAFNGLKLDDTVLPTAGFGLSGLSVGTINLNEVSVPAISSARLSVDEFSPNNALLLPSIRIENIELPSIAAPTVMSEGPIVVPDIKSADRSIPLIRGGILEASITVEPTFTMVINQMVINNISATSTIRKIDLRDLQSTVQLSDVTLNGLELNAVELENITTAS